MPTTTCSQQGCFEAGNVGDSVVTYLLEFDQHLLCRLLSVPGPMHRIVDDKVIRAQFVDNGGIGLSPELRKVLGDNLKIGGFFWGGHCE